MNNSKSGDASGYKYAYERILE